MWDKICAYFQTTIEVFRERIPSFFLLIARGPNDHKNYECAPRVEYPNFDGLSFTFYQKNYSVFAVSNVKRRPITMSKFRVPSKRMIIVYPQIAGYN